MGPVVPQKNKRRPFRFPDKSPLMLWMSRPREACDPQLGLSHLSSFRRALISKPPGPVKDSPPVVRPSHTHGVTGESADAEHGAKKTRGSRAPPPEARDPLGNPDPSRAYPNEAGPGFCQTAADRLPEDPVHFQSPSSLLASQLRLIPTR